MLFLQFFGSENPYYNYWLGGYRPTSSSGWSWLDSSPFIYTNWLKGSYDTSKRCIVFSGDDFWEWSTNDCDDASQDIRYRYICKKKNSEPETTTRPLTTQSGVNYGCEQGWSNFESSCYKLTNSLGDHKTFDEARDACKNDRADLVEIFSERENQFLVSMLRTRGAQSKRLGCPSGWTLAFDSCYQFIANATNEWKFGGEYCSRLGGNLVTIRSDNQQTFVADIIKSSGNMPILII